MILLAVGGEPDTDATGPLTLSPALSVSGAETLSVSKTRPSRIPDSVPAAVIPLESSWVWHVSLRRSPSEVIPPGRPLGRTTLRQVLSDLLDTSGLGPSSRRLLPRPDRTDVHRVIREGTPSCRLSGAHDRVSTARACSLSLKAISSVEPGRFWRGLCSVVSSAGKESL